MKQLLAINLQSCIDVITNSSSEIFQLRTDKSVEEVNKILSSFTTGFLPPMLFKLEEYKLHKDDLDKVKDELRSKYDFEKEEEFNKYWDEISEYERQHPELVVYDIVKGWFNDYSDPKELLNLQKEYLLPRYILSCYDPIQKEFRELLLNKGLTDDDIYRMNSEDLSDDLVLDFIKDKELPSIKEMCRDSWSYYDDITSLDGCIVVLSEGDNTMPYDDFDQIEELFNAERYHLG